MTEDWGGPYLQAALLCERVLREQDGVLSAIRIVDRIIQQATGMGVAVPQSMPPVAVDLSMLVTFKSGSSKGRSQIKITMEEPSGLLAPIEVSHSVLFEGEDRGVNAVFTLNLQLAKEGLYWFRVFLDDRFVTRIPLRIIYQPVQATTGAGPGPGP